MLVTQMAPKVFDVCHHGGQTPGWMHSFALSRQVSGNLGKMIIFDEV